MKENKFEFNYKVYDSISELPEESQWLLNEAREVSANAYAPYSNFQVGAVAKMANGQIVAGSNQENASFPVGLCAERVLLASISSLFPKVPIETIAISYRSDSQKSDHPISPCGICRQSLQEFEGRVNHPVQLILGGMEGPVYVIDSASRLLPLAFTSEELR
ncbi:cytidine deaminase [Flavisolibacter ginsenosidimutans]|uniref:Cytidine deaminase n=1 Tax=Flavisolibacter ginsenosidimutans TaxID=661481 RepID=A0A5B8UEE3_9BACT|nr:cytidine deaminase [Flavisolibacter ginsenosidimutans]QEC55051.1 cytidine deaminase [Flavisolibacter ginsenosidimutans]